MFSQSTNKTNRKKQQMQMDKYLDEEHQQMSKQVHHAELTMVMFLICHNLPFLLMDFLQKLLKECCPDSRIAQQLHCGRAKATELVDQLGKRSCEEITEKLRTNKFSLIVDETTDVSTKKCLILIVRFFDKFSRSVDDKF
uniref:DUF4371 domain-containing protein n=1 Tax=Bactrocera latifrons TaxID=174628 RepID=A0A0K8WKB5_BACLA